MSDQRYRDLQRRWEGTRSVDDEAALLREGLRIGAVVPAHARLAALLGHHAAQLAGVSSNAFPESPTLSDVRELLVPEIVAAGPPIVARATAALLDLIPTERDHAERLEHLRALAGRLLAGHDERLQDLTPTGVAVIDAAQTICLAVKLARGDRASAAVARSLTARVTSVAGEHEGRQAPWATAADVVQTWRVRLVPWLLPSLRLDG